MQPTSNQEGGPMAKELQQTEEACSEKEPKQQKPKLAIAEQITHLKS